MFLIRKSGLLYFMSISFADKSIIGLSFVFMVYIYTFAVNTVGRIFWGYIGTE